MRNIWENPILPNMRITILCYDYEILNVYFSFLRKVYILSVYINIYFLSRRSFMYIYLCIESIEIFLLMGKKQNYEFPFREY